MNSHSHIHLEKLHWPAFSVPAKVVLHCGGDEGCMCTICCPVGVITIYYYVLFAPIQRSDTAIKIHKICQILFSSCCFNLFLGFLILLLVFISLILSFMYILFCCCCCI